MTETDELASLRAQLKRLEKRQARAAGETDRTQRLLLAQLLVVIATVALFLSLSMGWYADVDANEESVESMSGWGQFTEMAASDEGAFVFAGAYSWVVVLAALVGGASVFTLRRRWFAGTMSTLLALLTAGQLLINMQDVDGEKLAGVWCAVIVITAGAFAWGNLVTSLREAEQDEG